jgi:hypothetical protein
MKTLKLIGTALFLISFVFLTNSCRRDPIPEPLEQVDYDTNKEESRIESEFNDAFNIVEDAMKRQDSNMKLASDTSCSTITINTSTKTITIDFGDGSCEGKDGKYRKGKIIVNYTGKYRTTGTIITTTFDNYHVNNIKIEGTKTVENMGDRKYKVAVRDAKMTFTDGTFISWKADRERVWTFGFDTPLNITDDIYTINGTSEGKRRNGNDFTTTSTNLEIKLSCWFQTPRSFYPVSGTKVVKNVTINKEHTIDFGIGTCDKNVTIKLNNGTIINVTLD